MVPGWGPRGSRVSIFICSGDEMNNKPRRAIPAKRKGKRHHPNLKLAERLEKIKAKRGSLIATVNHSPKKEDVSELLTQFTVDFLQNGYSSLVEKLIDKLSNTNSENSTEKSYFFWLLTYFLRKGSLILLCYLMDLLINSETFRQHSL